MRPAAFAYSPDQHDRMNLGLYVETTGTTFHVRVASKLVALNAKPLQQRVRDALDAGARDVVIDLRECEDIDARGFGVLVSLANAARMAWGGGCVTIANANEDLRSLFESHGIAKLFAFLDEVTP